MGLIMIPLISASVFVLFIPKVLGYQLQTYAITTATVTVIVQLQCFFI